MGDEVASETVAMKTFIGKCYFPYISIWEANPTFKLQRLINIDRDLNAGFLFINEELFSKCIGDLREGLVVPEMNWDSSYIYPERYCVWESFRRERFPTLQRETLLIEVAGRLFRTVWRSASFSKSNWKQPFPRLRPRTLPSTFQIRDRGRRLIRASILRPRVWNTCPIRVRRKRSLASVISHSGIRMISSSEFKARRSPLVEPPLRIISED